jgi:hypothetical protein
MIKNIPMKFMQQDVLALINPNFYGKYDYFYLPMDLKTQSSVGYAFINFIHPLFILDFYLTFNFIKWSNYMPNCNSGKLGQIVYANMQGMEQIKRGLCDKNVMKKNDYKIKPIILENL